MWERSYYYKKLRKNFDNSVDAINKRRYNGTVIKQNTTNYVEKGLNAYLFFFVLCGNITIYKNNV